MQDCNKNFSIKVMKMERLKKLPGILMKEGKNKIAKSDIR